MNYIHLQLSTGAILAVAPLPRELVGLLQATLNCIDALHNPKYGVDPCPPEFVKGYLNAASLTETQRAALTADQIASLVP